MNNRDGLLKKLKDPFHNRTIGIGLLVAMIINLGAWVVLYLYIKPSLDPIYLHYNIYFGIDLIGDWYEIYIIPLSGLLIILVNYLAGVILYPSNRVLSKLVVLFAVPVNIFLTLASVLLAFINR
ncbi:MAG: hypothetical protein WCW66_01575 [Patescibacteria group bacterium]|jgi:hypothetical protein